MQINYLRATEEKASGDLLVLPVGKSWSKYQSVRRLDAASGGQLIKRAKAARFKGERHSSFVLQNFSGPGPDRIVLWGMKNAKTLGAEQFWDFTHKVIDKFRSPTVKNIDFALDLERLPNPRMALARMAQGVWSGAYRFDRYRKDEIKRNSRSKIKKVVFRGFGDAAPTTAAGRKAVWRGGVVGESINLARDLVNEPAESMTPQIFASRARKLASELGLTCKVEGEKQIARKGMGLFLAVARGSVNPPRLVTLTHSPEKAKGKPIVLVGKGLMYDSGGYSLKPSAGMETMKCDMAGSAAVLGTMAAIARLGVRRKVIGIVAACENMIGSAAYRVGDIYTGMGGKTVEVLNTDAEGRLTLADALTYAQSFKPELIVDLATLTGACVVALGEETVGVFADGDTENLIQDAFQNSGEDAWPLPLNPRLKPLLKSKIADIKNVGGRWGGAITAALFLQSFIEGKQKWAHLDIAGPAFHKSASGHMPAGGSGVGVAAMVELIDPG